METVKISTQEEQLRKHCISTLSIHLEKSHQVDMSQYPFLNQSILPPCRAVDHEAYIKTLATKSNPDEYWKFVFTLVDALWGIDKSIVKEEFSSLNHPIYLEHVSRYEAFNVWLKNAIKSLTLREVVSTNNYLEKILHYLAGKQLFQAADLAIQHKDFRLATLLSQACSSELHADLQAQFNKMPEWTHYISDPIRCRIYRLLAGFCEKEIYQNLDWKRAYAFHAWYKYGPRANINSITSDFQHSFQNQKCAVPLPPYLEVVFHFCF